ncbi:hypothetical protein LMG23994_05247 [Cupriavidus pinatubonensis]|uniref:PNPLA domain-containing protein n=2 Tax=Cupriavidus pinatubonensis TaxID=248026 RepID=A0ABM8XUF1_9BURK|nr:hypothetical protein LMG23994_05247 [Cupriavidus pinatubonensis]
MLFDLGSLWRLNELGWLPKIDMITSVSGGSITNAVLATRWKRLIWDGDVATNFASTIAEPIIEFANRTVDAWAICKGLLSPCQTVSEKIALAYDKHLFLGSSLQEDVPEPVLGRIPRFLFYATSLQTGVSVRIERKRLGDYRIGEIPNPNLSIAKIVATSSAFPPFLSPSTLKLDPSLWVKTRGADLFECEDYRRRLVLTDGGVYDNIGMEALGRCTTVLVSDAGAPLAPVFKPSRNWFGQTRRAMDIVTEQTRALRRRMLMDDLGANQREGQLAVVPRKKGAYWRLKTKIGEFGLPNALATDNATTAALQQVRTRLNRFTPKEKGQLINWGYALTDAAMSRYVLDSPASTGALPIEEWPLQ